MSNQEFIAAPPAVKVGFTIIPIDLNINSMGILNQKEELVGFSDWVVETYEALSPERRRFNELLYYFLIGGIQVDYDPQDDFPSYVDSIAALDADAARDNIFNGVIEKAGHYGQDFGYQLPEDTQQYLTDRHAFLALVDQTFKAKYTAKGMEVDVNLFAELHDILQDPQYLKASIVEHLRYMWNHHLKAEWERNLPMLRECVEAFNQIDLSGQSTLEIIRTVTGRDMREQWSDLEGKPNIYFAPSAHIGPYLGFFTLDDDAYIIFGARMPAGTRESSVELSRSELLIRLSALADATRLTILEMLTKQDELYAQEIIEQLGLSQSSASRHLRQLTATGYLTERRKDVAKVYSLNPDRLEDTINALKQFLRR